MDEVVCGANAQRKRSYLKILEVQDWKIRFRLWRLFSIQSGKFKMCTCLFLILLSWQNNLLIQEVRWCCDFCQAEIQRILLLPNKGTMEDLTWYERLWKIHLHFTL
jgi:hypothetical protein